MFNLSFSDKASYGECLTDFIHNKCQSPESLSKCRRTCGFCTIGFENDYCYDKITVLTKTEIAKSPNFVSSHINYAKSRPETVLCQKIRNNNTDELEEYLKNTRFFLDLFKDFISDKSTDNTHKLRNLLCDGLGGQICQYSCGLCRENSAVDGSELDCYKKHNHAIKNKETHTLCPLSGKTEITE